MQLWVQETHEVLIFSGNPLFPLGWILVDPFQVRDSAGTGEHGQSVQHLMSCLCQSHDHGGVCRDSAPLQMEICMKNDSCSFSASLQAKAQDSCPGGAR